jgi:hypothetical protein
LGRPVDGFSRKKYTAVLNIAATYLFLILIPSSYVKFNYPFFKEKGDVGKI